MKTELIIALLGMACIGALAAFFVAWAKADEWKKTAADEHANYLAATRIGNTNAEYAQRIEQECEGLKIGIQYLTDQNEKLQDFKSSTLCPRNDHLWQDGVCLKCGRVKHV